MPHIFVIADFLLSVELYAVNTEHLQMQTFFKIFNIFNFLQCHALGLTLLK